MRAPPGPSKVRHAASKVIIGSGSIRAPGRRHRSKAGKSLAKRTRASQLGKARAQAGPRPAAKGQIGEAMTPFLGLGRETRGIEGFGIGPKDGPAVNGVAADHHRLPRLQGDGAQLLLDQAVAREGPNRRIETHGLLEDPAGLFEAHGAGEVRHRAGQLARHLGAQTGAFGRASWPADTRSKPARWRSYRGRPASSS